MFELSQSSACSLLLARLTDDRLRLIIFQTHRWWLTQRHSSAVSMLTNTNTVAIPGLNLVGATVLSAEAHFLLLQLPRCVEILPWRPMLFEAVLYGYNSCWPPLRPGAFANRPSSFPQSLADWNNANIVHREENLAPRRRPDTVAGIRLPSRSRLLLSSVVYSTSLCVFLVETAGIGGQRCDDGLVISVLERTETRLECVLTTTRHRKENANAVEKEIVKWAPQEE